MFADYRALVLEDYRRKKDRNELSLYLMLATPAKLRNECEAVFATRYLAKDEKTLKLFFGARQTAEGYEQAIRKVDIDKFRPLRNLLSNPEIGTDDKNIELLAWLIDFEPRPYHPEFNKAGKGRTEEAAMPGAPKTNKKPDREEKDYLPPPKVEVSMTQGIRAEKSTFLKKQKKSVFLLLVLAIAGSGSYLGLTNFLAPQQCMYWTGEAYQPVDCNEEIKDTPVLALEAEKVERFKKITRADTITSRALGTVWYSKIDNRLEFFTSGGIHPVHDERRLKPLSKYIIEKYLSGNSQPSAR